jgi:hypothetical protein
MKPTESPSRAIDVRCPKCDRGPCQSTTRGATDSRGFTEIKLYPGGCPWLSGALRSEQPLPAKPLPLLPIPNEVPSHRVQWGGARRRG